MSSRSRGAPAAPSQMYLDNLKDFLESADWQEQLSMFVNANCDKFLNITDFLIEHHKIWQDFIELAEAILAMGMESLGGSLEKLEDAIDEMSRRPATGPRDEQFKDILNRLLSFHSFEAFVANMKRAAQDKARGRAPPPATQQRRAPQQQQLTPLEKYRDNLLALGFELDMIQIVCEGAPRSVTLEELVMQLSELGCQPSSPNSKMKLTPPRHNFNKSSGGGGGGNSSSPAPNASSGGALHGRRAQTMNKYYVQDDDAYEANYNSDSKEGVSRRDYGGYEGGGNEDSGYSDYEVASPSGKNDVSSDDFIFGVLNLFVQEGKLKDDASELYAKFSTAKSIMDMLAMGKRCSDLGYDESNQNNLVDWSSEMLELYEDIGRRYLEQLNSYSGGGGSRFTNLLQGNDSSIFKDPHVTRYGKPFFKTYGDLEAIRADLNSSSSHGMLSDYDLKRMAELDNIASTGTEDEQKLHKLITRFDSLQKEINDCHKNVSLAVAQNRAIDRVKLEEMYLYLKEMVNNETDISQISDELYSKVVTVSSVDSSANKKSIFAIVGILLDMHVLEDEQYILRREIDILCGGGGGGGGSPSNVERRGAQAKSGGFDDASEYGHVVQGEGQGGEGGGYGDGSFDNGYSNGYSDDKQSGYEGDSQYGRDGGDYSSGGGGGGGEYKSESKADSDVYTSSAVGGGDSKAGGGGTSSQDDVSMTMAGKESSADFLNTLKASQKNALQSLKGSLEAEKSRRMSLLEDKLRKKKMRQGLEGIPTDRDLTESEMHDLIANNVKAVEQELSETKDYFEGVQEGLINGFKQKCMAEMKEAKNKGRALNEKELDDCHMDLVKALRDKHDKEQKTLIEGLEFERQKQKQRILRNLAQKKLKLQSQNGSSIDPQSVNNYIAEEMRKELENLNNHFDATILEVSSKPQSKAFMAISAVMIDDNVINSMNANKKKTDDDEDDYLEDSPTPKTQAIDVPVWLDAMESTCNNFVVAGQELQSNVVKAARQYADDLSVESRLELLDNFDSSDQTESGASELGSIHSAQIVNSAFTKAIAEAMSQRDADLRWHKNKSDSSAAIESAKQDIISEFKKSQAKYSEELENARAKSLRRLAANRAQSKSNRSGADDDSQADSKENNTIEIVSKGRVGSSINSVIDYFLDTPLEISRNTKPAKISAYGHSHTKSTTNYKLSPLKSGPSYVLNPFVADASELADAKGDDSSSLPAINLRPNRIKLEEAVELENKAERDIIKARYNTKEKELVDGLYTQMMIKKTALQDKLRKKQEERDRLKAQNASTSNIVADMDSTDETEEDQIKKLETAYDKVVNLVKTEGSETINLDTALATMNKLAAERGKSTSDSYTEQLREVDVKQKEMMKEEAKRIASTYNEEKEKYDLMMQMQQARQRQNLQRKLLEKKQNALMSGAGAGYSSQAAPPARIPFGATNANASPDSAGSSSYVNEPTSQAAIEHHKMMKQMSSRGMGMQNLMRR